MISVAFTRRGGLPTIEGAKKKGTHQTAPSILTAPCPDMPIRAADSKPFTSSWRIFGVGLFGFRLTIVVREQRVHGASTSTSCDVESQYFEMTGELVVARTGLSSGKLGTLICAHKTACFGRHNVAIIPSYCVPNLQTALPSRQ